MSRFSLGRRLLSERQTDRARECFINGVLEGEFLCIYGLVRVYETLGDACGAERYLNVLAPHIKKIKQMANRNNEDAILALADCYENGWCVEKDVDKAIACYSLISETNDIAAFNLGCLYINSNLQAAVYWFNKGAEKGDTEAIYNAGYCYLRLGGDENTEKAHSCFLRAFEKGDENAAIALNTYFGGAKNE